MKSELLLQVEQDVGHVMREHLVSYKTGFLVENPLRFLPRDYDNWERDKDFLELDHIAYSLEQLVREGRVAITVGSLGIPSWSFSDLSWEVAHRLMLIYAMLTHAYFREILHYYNVSELMEDSSIKYLPPQLAIPMWELGKITGIAPSMSYELYSLWNHHKKDNRKPFSLDNIDLIHSFTGSISEKWFMWIHQIIEVIVAQSIVPLLKAYLLAKHVDTSVEEVTFLLKKAGRAENRAVSVLRRMREHCDSGTYFNEIRLFYSFPRKVVFVGVEDPKVKDKPLDIMGETGGESASRQLRLLALGIRHQDDAYFPRMREHMSRPHRKLLEMLLDSTIREFVLDHKGNDGLVEGYNILIQSYVDWRAEHLSLVHDFIQVHGEGHGTGKPPLGWLEDLLEETRTYLIVR